MKTKDLEKQKVVCYGEVLWDIFPTKTKPGGAPMNVAYHLQKFGVESHMISRVGNDQSGWSYRICWCYRYDAFNMPESVLVRFKGEMQPGITLRDLVNAIPYQAIQDGLLTVEKKVRKMYLLEQSLKFKVYQT